MREIVKKGRKMGKEDRRWKGRGNKEKVEESNVEKEKRGKVHRRKNGN